MSKGPGRIERAIAGILDRSPGNAFTTEELCEKVYRTKQVQRKHRVAVLRAAASLAKRRDTLGVLSSETLGYTKVYYTIDNVLSYGMARLKADNLYHYRSNDERVSWDATSEKELRATLARGGREYHLVKPGGTWWEHVQSKRAELAAQRRGDKRKVKEILAARKKAYELRTAKILGGLGGFLGAARRKAERKRRLPATHRGPRPSQ
jgi:hypothetical protein